MAQLTDPLLDPDRRTVTIAEAARILAGGK